MRLQVPLSAALHLPKFHLCQKSSSFYSGDDTKNTQEQPSIYIEIRQWALRDKASCLTTRHWHHSPGGSDCFSFSAFSLSVMTSVYRYLLQRTLNLTLSLFFLIFTAAGIQQNMNQLAKQALGLNIFVFILLMFRNENKHFWILIDCHFCSS